MAEKAEKGKPAPTPQQRSCLRSTHRIQKRPTSLEVNSEQTKGGDSIHSNQRGGGGGETSRVGRTGKRKAGSANTKRGRTIYKYKEETHLTV